MSNYKKRSQSLMDEISENLKRTIKKYNEIEMDNDLSVIHSIDNEESNSIPKKEINNKEVYDSMTKFDQNEKNLMKQSNSSFGYNFDYKNSNMSGVQPKKESPSKMNSQVQYNSKQFNNYPSPNNNSQLNRVINSLDNMGAAINQDFAEIEDMLENIIQKEMKLLTK
jgi:hypothetical protein